MEYLWLLPALLPAVGFFWKPCGCCRTRGEGYVVTDDIGDGHVICIGDGNVYSTASGDTNDQFWLNVRDWIGPGTIGAFGAISGDAQWLHLPSSCRPTQANVTEADLGDVVAIYAGFYTTNCGPMQEVPTTFYPALKSWIEAGGVLMLVGEWRDPGVSNCMFDSYLANLNGTLTAVGSACQFTSKKIDCNIIPSPTGVLPGHELTDGTFGSAITGIYYGCTTTIDNGYVVASPDGGV